MLSSAELLDYLEFMDDEGAFKTAARGGGWPDWKQMLAEAANQQYRSLAWYLAFKSTDDHDWTFDPTPFLFLDPATRRAQAEQDAVEAELSKQTDAELAEAGWM